MIPRLSDGFDRHVVLGAVLGVAQVRPHQHISVGSRVKSRGSQLYISGRVSADEQIVVRLVARLLARQRP